MSEAFTVHPLSPGQQQLWFLQQLAPQQTAYNLPRVFELQGPLDADALARAFQAVVQRHAVLRTAFVEDAQGQVQQRVWPSLAFGLQREDLSSLEGAAQQAAVDAAVRRVATHVFDLRRAPALQALLLRCGEERHVLAVCLHHIVSDAASNPVMARDLSAAYRLALRQPGAVALPALARSYAEHAAQQREQLQGETLAALLAHWQAYLGPQVPALSLPTDHARPAEPRFEGRALSFALPQALCLALRSHCRAERSTPFVAMLAAWQLLLARWSGQRDFAIGTPHAGRDDEACDGLMGFFVNTLVHRVRLQPGQTLREVARRVRADVLEALAHAQLPLEMLAAQRNEPRQPGLHPLFQVLFGLQMDDAAATGLDLAGVRSRFIEFDEAGAKFDLSLDAYVRADGVQCRLEYASSLFTPATAQWLAAAYVRVLTALLHTPDTTLGELDIAGPDERRRVAAWREGAAALQAAPAGVHQRIAAIAHTAPTDPALVMAPDLVMSYATLEARANQLAHALLARGLQPEQRVGVALPRSPALVVALLAVLKAGGAFVPLDPELPPARLAMMAEDSGAVGVLTPPGEAIVGLAAWPHWPVPEALDPAGPQHDPGLPVHPLQLAYVLFTSGSTGRPKGAANTHGALVNRLAWMQQAYPLARGDTVLQKTPIGFDVSVWEFFWPLMVGARLALAAPGAHREPARLAEAIEAHAVRTLHFVPSMLNAFLADEDAARRCASVRDLICSGEALPAELHRRLAARLPGVRLHNLYGPTEAAIDVTHWTCRAEDLATEAPVPIGAPIAGISLRVLDAELHEVPAGVPGELYLGGVGLARGYLGRAALSAERFVADPLSPDGARLYRTGDLVRWQTNGAPRTELPPGPPPEGDQALGRGPSFLDGQLVYLGRLDHQLKLRGQRIELGEIEAQLLGQPGVAEAVVVALPAEGAAASAPPERLVAYLAPQQGERALAAIQAALATRLPAYMLPTQWVSLPRLPLNANGKIDRAALPAPGRGAGPAGLPLQAGEQALAALWAEVLNLPADRIGRDDNFFDLGGHSLKLVALQALLKQRMDLSLPLVELFALPTVAALARRLSQPVSQPAPPAMAEPLAQAGDEAMRQREALARRRRRAAAAEDTL